MTAAAATPKYPGPRWRILPSIPVFPQVDIALGLLARSTDGRALAVIGDKGYAGPDLEAAAHNLGASIIRPRRTDQNPADRPT